jgi:ATP-binding cassette subfamily F protein uup
VLVLDEPTNDLDLETLDLLEELLIEYSGTLLVVSHDREFLDNVVTSTLVLEGQGKVGEYVGGYSDWMRQRSAPVGARTSRRATGPAATAAKSAAKAAGQSAAKGEAKKRRLSFKESEELKALPDKIDACEIERGALYVSMADPAFLRDGAAVAGAKSRLSAIDAELTKLTERWESLETIAAEAGQNR